MNASTENTDPEFVTSSNHSAVHLPDLHHHLHLIVEADSQSKTSRITCAIPFISLGVKKDRLRKVHCRRQKYLVHPNTVPFPEKDSTEISPADLLFLQTRVLRQ